MTQYDDSFRFHDMLEHAREAPEMIWRSVHLRHLIGSPNPVFEEETGFLRLDQSIEFLPNP